MYNIGFRHNFQNTNTPDFNLDRDIEIEEELLGIETANLSDSNKKFKINLSTIILSAIIFLMILAWFDFIQTAFYSLFNPQSMIDIIPSSTKFWYAIFITIFVLILVVLIYYYSSDLTKF